MNLWSVEHFLDISFIKIRFSCDQNIGETLAQCKKVSDQLPISFIKIRFSCNQNIGDIFFIKE